MEPVDPPATGPMEPLEAPLTTPTEAVAPANAPAPSGELPTPVHVPAVDPPVRPTVARRRLKELPAGATALAIRLIPDAGVRGGWRSGAVDRHRRLPNWKAANSGSSSSGHTPSSVGRPAPNRRQPPPTAGGTTSASGSTTSASGSATRAPASAHTATFTGRAFSIKYPAGWIIQTNEKRYPWGTDTTVVSPTNASTLLRVDVSPNLKTSDPRTASRAEINQVSQQPGYQQLGLNSNTVNGNPGERWEFRVNESGVVEHSVDQFIITPSGDGLAILTQAPASQYASLAKEFTALRQTIAVP